MGNWYTWVTILCFLTSAGFWITRLNRVGGSWVNAMQGLGMRTTCMCPLHFPKFPITVRHSSPLPDRPRRV
jgi:hypothetical protein